MIKKPLEVPNHVEKRAWYEDYDAYAFLVDQPVTFGHSQLVIRIPEAEDEHCSFLRASPHIAKCIERLRTALPKSDAPGWEALADYTQTSGFYVKTLLLRVSANEERSQYKVHLVPYFESHLDATNRLYRATHPYAKKKGGLLHWLGQREVLLDYDMRKGRKEPMVCDRVDSFRLDELAKKLRGAGAGRGPRP